MLLKKQYQNFDKVYHGDGEEKSVTIKNEEPEIIHKLKLIKNNKYTFSEQRNGRKYLDNSFESK